MEDFNSDSHDQFLRLYVENEEALSGFVRSLVPTREDALDVMQGTAVVLWKKFEKLIHQKIFAVGHLVLLDLRL